MPYKTRKVRNKRCYTVYKTKGERKVFSKCTTKLKAKKQIRLLNAIKYNKNFKPYSKKRNNITIKKS